MGRASPSAAALPGQRRSACETLIVNDAQADPRRNVSFDRTTEFVTRNMICVPMISHDRLVGVIEAINKQHGPGGFSERDAELLTGFASQAAITIENARLFTMTDQALAERVQELHTMQLVDQQLNASLDFQHVMDLTLEHSMDSVAASAGVVGVMDEEGTGFYLAAQRGMPAEYARYREELWPLEQGIIGQAGRTGKSLIASATDQDPAPKPMVAGNLSQMAVPVVNQGVVRAVIHLENPHRDAFSQDGHVLRRPAGRSRRHRHRKRSPLPAGPGSQSGENRVHVHRLARAKNPHDLHQGLCQAADPGHSRRTDRAPNETSSTLSRLTWTAWTAWWPTCST